MAGLVPAISVPDALPGIEIPRHKAGDDGVPSHPARTFSAAFFFPTFAPAAGSGRGRNSAPRCARKSLSAAAVRKQDDLIGCG